MSEKYCPIDLPDRFPDDNLPFDLFVLLENQYLKFRQQADSVGKDLIIKLKNQSMSQLFITSDKVKMYFRLLNMLLEEAVSGNTDASKDEVGQMVVSSASTCIKQLAQDPTSKEAYTGAEKTAQGMIELIKKDEDFINTLFQNHSGNAEIIEHSKNVASLAVLVAIKLKQPQPVIEALGVAGFLHDLGVMGLSDADKEIFNKDKNALSPAEKKNFAKHVSIAENALSDRPYMNNDVVTLIGDHEKNLGTHPNLKLPSQIISLTNMYDKWITVLKMDPKECLKELKLSTIGLYDLNLLNTFTKAVKEIKTS